MNTKSTKEISGLLAAGHDDDAAAYAVWRVRLAAMRRKYMKGITSREALELMLYEMERETRALLDVVQGRNVEVKKGAKGAKVKATGERKEGAA